MMNWTNAKVFTAMAAAALLAAVAVLIIEQREAARLRGQNQAFLEQQANLAKERDEALSALSARELELKQSQGDNSELLRLRGEAGRLRNQNKDLEALRAQNRQ